MMEYLLDKYGIRTTKKVNLFILPKSLYTIDYPHLLCPNPRIMHVPLDVQVLVVIVPVDIFVRKRKLTIILYCAKVAYEP